MHSSWTVSSDLMILARVFGSLNGARKQTVASVEATDDVRFRPVSKDVGGTDNLGFCP